MNMGLVHHASGDYNRAVQLFNEALNQYGSVNDKANVHYNFAVLHWCRGKYVEARDNFMQALRLTNDQVLKNTINQKLENLNKISPSQPESGAKNDSK